MLFFGTGSHISIHAINAIAAGHRKSKAKQSKTRNRTPGGLPDGCKHILIDGGNILEAVTSCPQSGTAPGTHMHYRFYYLTDRNWHDDAHDFRLESWIKVSWCWNLERLWTFGDAGWGNRKHMWHSLLVPIFLHNTQSEIFPSTFRMRWTSCSDIRCFYFSP